MFAPNLRHLIPSTCTDDEADRFEDWLDRCFEDKVSDLVIVLRSRLCGGKETHAVEIADVTDLTKPLKDFASDDLQEALVLAEGYREKEAVRRVQVEVPGMLDRLRNGDSDV